MSFGARLTEARKRKGLTQDGLGKGLGTDGKDASKAVVYGWEKDQHYPRVDQLVLICQKLDEDADWLLFGRRAAKSLSPELADLATQIDALPQGRPREWVMLTLREAVKIAHEMVTESAVTRDQQSTTADFVPPSSNRRRAA